MANNSPGGYLQEMGKEDGMARTVPCLDAKRLDKGHHKEDDPTYMSERIEPFSFDDLSGVDLKNQSGPKTLETSENKEEVGACATETRAIPVLSSNPTREDFNFKQAEDMFPNTTHDSFRGAAEESTSMFDEKSYAKSDRPSTSMLPNPTHHGKAQPLSVSRKLELEECFHSLQKPENPFRNSVRDRGTQPFGNWGTQLTQTALPNPKHNFEYSSGAIPKELKTPADETNTSRNQIKAAAAKRLPEDEKPSLPHGRKTEKKQDTGSDMPTWSFKDGKEFPNREPQCLRDDSATHVQELNKDKAPSTGNRSCSEINKGSPIFGYEESRCATEKKYLCFDNLFRMITDNKTLEEEIACTASRSDTEFSEGIYAERHRTSKTLIECCLNEASASNIVTHKGHDTLQSFAAMPQIKQEGEYELCGSRIFITEREDEDDYLHRHQNDEAEEKPGTKPEIPNTSSTRQKKSSCARQLGKENASLRSDEIAPRHTLPSTDHDEQVQDKTLKQEQQTTLELVGTGNLGRTLGRDFEIGHNEYPRKSDRDAEVLTFPEEKNKYTHEQNGDRSCMDNRDMCYSPWLNQKLAELLHQDQLNVRDEELASGTYTTAGARNASEVPAILFLASTDRNGRTFSAQLISVKVKDGSDKTFLCRDASLKVQPGPPRSGALGNDSSDSQMSPDDVIIGFTAADDYTPAQTDGRASGMNAQYEHSVLPDNPTPALDEKEDSIAAERGKRFVSTEDAEGHESRSTRCSFKSDPSNSDLYQHAGDNEGTTVHELNAIHILVLSVGLTGSMSENDLETSYNASNGLQDQRKQDNAAKFVLDTEVKTRSVEVLARMTEVTDPERSKGNARIHPGVYENGTNSNADFNEENDKNRTRDMPASFGAVSVLRNTTAPASQGMNLNDRNFNNCSDNHLKSEDDLEDLSAVRHGLLTDPPSPSSRKSPFFTDTFHGKATHRRTAKQPQRESMPCSVHSHVTHEKPAQSEIVQTQNNCLFKSDGELQKVHNDKYTSPLSKGSEWKGIKLHDCGDQQSSLAEKKEQRENNQLSEDSSDVPFIVLEEERQYKKPGMVNWQDDSTENIRDFRFLSTDNISESGIGFSDHRFPFKQNMQGIELHRNSNPVSQSSSRERSDLEMLARKANTKEHFLPEDLFSFDEQRPSSIKKYFTLFEKEFLPWFETPPSSVKGPRDKNAIDSCLSSHLHLRSTFLTCIVACPVHGKKSPDPPNLASDDEGIEGPQDEDRDPLEDGARSSTPPQPRQPDRLGTAGRETEPGRAVICLDLSEPGARGEHQPPRLWIPCQALRQTEIQGTSAREGELGGAVICVDRVERGTRGERRLSNRGILYTAHPCCCLLCLSIHLRANIGLHARAVPFPTECREDGCNYMNAGTPQVFVSTFLRHRGPAAERSSRPCDVSRLSQTGRRIWCPNSTCRGNWTQDSFACLDCQGVHVRQNETIRVEQQPCSHINSTTQSTVEEVDSAVHDRGRFHHIFVAPEHGLCVMCATNAVNTRLYNCQHQAVCRHCARFVRVCPMCGEPVGCFSVF